MSVSSGGALHHGTPLRTGSRRAWRLAARAVLVAVSLPVILVPDLGSTWWIIWLTSWLVAGALWAVLFVFGPSGSPAAEAGDFSGVSSHPAAPWRNGSDSVALALAVGFVVVALVLHAVGAQVWLAVLGGLIFAAAYSVVSFRRGWPSDAVHFSDSDYWAPGWVHNTAIALLVAFTCSVFSAPHGYFDRGLVCAIAWLLAGLVWLGRLFVQLFAARGHLREVKWRAWLVQPALSVLLGALIYTHAPLWAAYLYSRDAMNDQARAALAGKDPSRITRIGAFVTDSAQAGGGDFAFIVSGTGDLLNGNGAFAYSTDGPPTLDTVAGCKHWDGHWYICDSAFGGY